MEIALVCSLKNFRVLNQEKKKFSLSGFKLETDLTFLDSQFLNSNVVKVVGMGPLSQFSSYPYFGQIIKDNRQYSSEELYKLSFYLSEHLHFFMFMTWFVKDNSSNLETLYTHCKDINMVFPKDRTPRFSNCTGMVEDAIFTFDELVETRDLYNAINQIVESTYLETPDFVPGLQKMPFDFIDYSVSNQRIERALHFLNMARSASFLPEKISFYILVYECLVSTDTSEASHKVAERVTTYIGGNGVEKITNFKLIKSAYAIRSKYFHGSPLNTKDNPNKLKDVKSICIEIDNLTRILFTKVILSDSSKFKLNSEELEVWFNSLLFS